MRVAVWSTGWGDVTICGARRPEPQELEQYAPEVRDQMLYATAPSKTLHYVKADDLFDMLGDPHGYYMPGCDNRVWVLTPEQEAALIRLEEERHQREASEIKVAAERVERKHAEALARARDTGQEQLIRQIMMPCDGSAVDCSLDIVQVVALPDGRIVERRVHTH